MNANHAHVWTCFKTIYAIIVSSFFPPTKFGSCNSQLQTWQADNKNNNNNNDIWWNFLSHDLIWKRFDWNGLLVVTTKVRLRWPFLSEDESRKPFCFPWRLPENVKVDSRLLFVSIKVWNQNKRSFLLAHNKFLQIRNTFVFFSHQRRNSEHLGMSNPTTTLHSGPMSKRELTC